MKRKIAAAIAFLFTVLVLSGFISNDNIQGVKNEDPVMYDAVQEGYAGTWELSYDNDRQVLDRSFPDIYAFGSELTIRSDGKIYWHIGAAGAAGTYDAYDNQLTACVSDIMEFDEYRIGLTINDEGDLLMKYKSVPLKWTYISEIY